MSVDDPDSLESFIQRHGSSDLSGRVINPTGVDAIQTMIGDLFGSLDVSVSEAELDSQTDDMFLLVDGETVVASTPINTIRETLLMINTDLYRTGTQSLEDVTAPDVLLNLSDTVFQLVGYPQSNTEKLVLTLMARYIERQAWLHEGGVIRASFQRLSRLYNEKGTRRVYERLGELPELDVHAYGIPDLEPPEDLPVTIHGLDTEELRQSWFVIHHTDDGDSVGMLALERGPNEWDGYWTFDTDEIEALNRYIRRSF
jgi:hypothetical protein